MADRIDIIITDDHASFREALSAKLSSEGIVTIAEAANGLQLLTSLETHQPDILLLDLAMPGMNGFEAFQKIKKKYPGLKVIVLTSFNEPTLRQALKKVGANAFLSKAASTKEIIATIRAVHESASYTNIKTESKGIFTKGEAQVIPHILAGKTSKEIAQALNKAPKTIENIRNRLYEKAHVKNASQFSAYCATEGLNLLGTWLAY